MHAYALILGSSFILTTVTLARRKHLVISCACLLSRFHDFQLRGLDDFVGLDDEPDPKVPIALLYARSHGMVGLWKRWRNRRVLMGLAQVLSCIGNVTVQERAYIDARIEGLTRASITAVGWYLLRCIAPERAAKEGQKAIRMYKELAYMVCNIYGDETNNLCGKRFAFVL